MDHMQNFSSFTDTGSHYMLLKRMCTMTAKILPPTDWVNQVWNSESRVLLFCYLIQHPMDILRAFIVINLMWRFYNDQSIRAYVEKEILATEEGDSRRGPGAFNNRFQRGPYARSMLRT